MSKIRGPRQNLVLTVAISLVLAGLVWLVFGQTLHHDFLNYDDETYVYENPRIIPGLTRAGIFWAFTHVYSSNWHPLTWISHMLDCQLFGLNASGHHFTNVLLHTLAVLLLFLALQKMTGAIWRSAFVATVFALHPLRVESVAWIAERKDVLSGVFCMLTLIAYSRYVSKPFSIFRYLLVLCFFALGLMAKPMLVSLPFVLLLLDYWPLKRIQKSEVKSSTRNSESGNFERQSFVRLVIEKIPFFVLSLASSVATLWAAQQTAVRSITQVPVFSRILNAVFAYVHYLRQLLWPVDLAPFYPYRREISLLFLIASVGLLIGITALVLRLGRKYPYLVTGWCWYLIMLLPVIGLVQVGAQSAADRYTYLPQIGIVLAFTWTIADAAARRPKLQSLVGFAAVASAVVLAAVAYQQTRYWRTNESLWLHTLAVTKNNHVAHNNLGDLRLKAGQIDQAFHEFQTALKGAPDFSIARNNLGLVYLREGKTSEAVQQFRRVLAIDPQNVKSRFHLAAAFLESGIAEMQKGNRTEAIRSFQNALASKPNYPAAQNNLAVALLLEGKIDEAIPHLERSAALEPENVQTRNNLAAALASKQQWSKAIQHWRRSLEIDPNNFDARLGLAWTLATSPDGNVRNGAEALALSQQLAQTTSDPQLLRLRAAAYAERGKFPEASETAKRAIDLATSQNRSDLAAALLGDLKLFQSAQPLRGATAAPTTR